MKAKILIEQLVNEYAADDARNFLSHLKPEQQGIWKEFAVKFSPEEVSSDKEAMRQLSYLPPEKHKLVKPLVDQFIKYVDMLHVKHDQSILPPPRYSIRFH